MECTVDENTTNTHPNYIKFSILERKVKMKRFSHIIAGVAILTTAVVSSIAASASWYTNHHISFDYEYRSQNQEFDGNGGRDIQLCVDNSSCDVAGASYYVSLIEQVGLLTTQEVPVRQHKPISTGKEYAWWQAEINHTYHYMFSAINNETANHVRADINMATVDIYNF